MTLFMTPAPALSITGLRIAVSGAEIVHGLDLTIMPGEVHAIMGPNGSGKSTLANALMGHPAYEITGGTVTLHGDDLLAMEPHERALAGLFLAFQYPKEIAGVSLRSFLFAAYRAKAEHDASLPRLTPLTFQRALHEAMKGLKMDTTFAERSLNKGFSGGEKKKAEILQMTMLKPSMALLDETDSGLDVDALRTVADGVNAMKRAAGSGQRAAFSALVVTHYARILDHLTPDKVHVMVKGKIVESGDASFAKRLETEGYAKYGVEEKKTSIGLEVQ
jgi:Fe-S cluster assembly ATP-binding protein